MDKYDGILYHPQNKYDGIDMIKILVGRAPAQKDV